MPGCRIVGLVPGKGQVSSNYGGAEEASLKAEPPSKGSIRWPRLTGFRGRTVWDRLELLGTLAVPIVVVVVGAIFSAQQSRTHKLRSRSNEPRMNPTGSLCRATRSSVEHYAAD